MRFRPAGNPDNAWPNKHTLYIAASGGGKSQCLLQNPAIPKRGVPVIMWDHKPDHPGLHIRDRRQFVQYLRRGIERHQKTGAGFRIAFAGDRTIANFEWWCEVVWAVLDSRRRTYVIVEELAAVSPSPAKATPAAGILIREGRGYGMVFHGTTQRPQEVAKTFYENCDIRFYGRVRNAKLRKAWADEMDIDQARLRALENLQFLHDDGSASPPKQINLKYREPKGITWL